MLAKRIITTLMLNNGVLFRSKNFIPDYRFTLNFIDMWSVDEIILLDITRELDFDSEKKYFFF
jgi:imidazole glycerol phosphate synthase subunit HisF